ncbi:MAG: NAD(P)-binding domain-containing protein [Pseudomonadota bacterium]
MQVGIVGVRDAAEPLSRRLAAAGVRVVVHDTDRERLRHAGTVAGVVTRRSLATLARALKAPRTLLLFEPDAVRDLAALARCAGAGGLIADAGEGALEAPASHAAALAAEGVRYVDVAVFASPASVEAGFGVVTGGSREAFGQFEPLARVLGFGADYAALRAGPAGAARFLRALQALLARQSLAGVEQLFRGIQQAPEFVSSPAALLSAWQAGAAGVAEIGALCDRYLALAEEADAPAVTMARAWSTTAKTAAAWFERLAAATGGANR